MQATNKRVHTEEYPKPSNSAIPNTLDELLQCNEFTTVAAGGKGDDDTVQVWDGDNLIDLRCEWYPTKKKAETDISAKEPIPHKLAFMFNALNNLKSDKVDLYVNRLTCDVEFLNIRRRPHIRHICMDAFVVVEPGTEPTPGLFWYADHYKCNVYPLVCTSKFSMLYSAGYTNWFRTTTKHKTIFDIGADGKPHETFLKAMGIGPLYDTYMEAYSKTDKKCHAYLKFTFKGDTRHDKVLNFYDMYDRPSEVVNKEIRDKVNDVISNKIPESVVVFDQKDREFTEDLVYAVIKSDGVRTLHKRVFTEAEISPHKVKPGQQSKFKIFVVPISFGDKRTFTPAKKCLVMNYDGTVASSNQ